MGIEDRRSRGGRSDRRGGTSSGGSLGSVGGGCRRRSLAHAQALGREG